MVRPLVAFVLENRAGNKVFLPTHTRLEERLFFKIPPPVMGQLDQKCGGAI